MKSLKSLSKEQIMWISILCVVALFIIFMPSIESLLSGRKLKKTEPMITDSNKTGEIHTINYPSVTNCTLAETLDQTTDSNLSKKLVFTFSANGTVTKIDETKIYRYTDVSKYNKVKDTKALNQNGIRQTVTPNDKDMILTINNIITVADIGEMIEYPVGYTELKNYLTNNKYICTETK